MKRTFILFQFLLLTFGLHSQGFYKARLDSLFARIERNQMGMGSISIFKNGKEVYRNSIGFVDINKGIRASADTKYRIGSVSKSITAAIIVQLFEERRLDPVAYLSDYFPDIPNAEKITMVHLLRHQSGLYNFTNSADYSSWMQDSMSKQDLIDIITRSGTVFNPGEKTEYSNANYVLLSYIAEKVEGIEFTDILNKRIIKPLKLKNTYYGGKIDPEKNEAFSYTSFCQWELAPETNMSIPAGAGGIVSTPTDLNIFYTGLFNSKTVTKHSLGIMKEINGDFGMGLFQIPFHKRMGYGHNGKIDEFFTMAVYFPEDNVSVAYTSNGGLFPVNDILTGVLSIYFKKEYVLPDFKPGIELKTEDLDKYPGTYSSPDFPLKINICRQDDILIGQATGQSAFILEAYELHKFKYDQAMLKIEFLPEDEKLILQQGGREIIFTKEE